MHADERGLTKCPIDWALTGRLGYLRNRRNLRMALFVHRFRRLRRFYMTVRNHATQRVSNLRTGWGSRFLVVAESRTVI